MELKDRLNILSDRLTAEIRIFEMELESMELGVQATIRLSDKVTLTYGKWQGKWRLIVKSVEADGTEKSWALAEAPRSLRLFGYRKRKMIVPALIEAATALADKMARALTNVIEEDADDQHESGSGPTANSSR